MVSIMTLDRLKVGAEMMAVVNGPKKNNVEIDENVAKTTEGKMVVTEANKAVGQGVLHPAVAAVIVKKVLANEAVGKPVLVTTTKEGAQRMTEVAKAQNAGTLSQADAKQVAAKIVVHEAVMKAKMEEHSQRHVSIHEPQHVEEHVSVAELAEEVMRRKQEETVRRGTQPSSDELRKICAGVMEDYRQSASCGLDCAKPALSNVSENDISGNDDSASSYASVDHN
jgi:hypothetical protein